jgi:hypothetical protein
MPYKDPEKQRAAVRRSQAKALARPLTEALGTDELPDPPGRDELIRLLGVKARAGNVPAMKILLELEKNSDGDSESSETRDPLAAVHQLAERRRAA